MFKDVKVGEKEDLPDYNLGPEMEFTAEKVDKLLSEA